MYKRRLFHYSFNRSGKKLYLRERDLQVLRFVYDVTYLTTTQIQALYTSLCGKNIHYRTTKDKLDNYSAYGGLLSKRVIVHKSGNFKQAYYMLTSAGIQLLIDNGFLSPSSSLAINKKQFNIHNSLAKEVIVRTFSSISRRNGSESCSNMLRDAELSTFFRQEKIEFSGNSYGFIPDQMITYNNKKIFVELDLITSPINEIADKLSSYLTYAKDNPTWEIAVVFTTADDSTSNKVIQKPPYLRLSRILFAMLKYKQQVREAANLDIFVTSLSDSGEVVSDYLLDTYRINSELIEESVLKQFTKRDIDDSHWRYVFLNEKFPAYDEKVDGGIRRINRTDKRVYRDFIFIYGHENNFDTIARIDDVISSQTPEAEQYKVPLIVLYPPRDIHRHILLMDKYDDTYLLHMSNMDINLLTSECIYVEHADHVVPYSRSVIEIY